MLCWDFNWNNESILDSYNVFYCKKYLSRKLQRECRRNFFIYLVVTCNTTFHLFTLLERKGWVSTFKLGRDCWQNFNYFYCFSAKLKISHLQKNIWILHRLKSCFTLNRRWRRGQNLDDLLPPPELPRKMFIYGIHGAQCAHCTAKICEEERPDVKETRSRDRIQIFGQKLTVLVIKRKIS